MISTCYSCINADELERLVTTFPNLIKSLLVLNGHGSIELIILFLAPGLEKNHLLGINQ